MSEHVKRPDLGSDLLTPRVSFLTNRQWMEPYATLEDFELQARQAAQSRHARAMLMWLKCIGLLRDAFSQQFDWSNQDDITIQERNIRMNLLGLAGTSSKPTLDALIAGYYSPAYGMIRNLLETWRREVGLRLAPSVVLPYFEFPTESPIDADGNPRKGRNQGIPYTVMANIFKEYANDSEREQFKVISAGIVHMHAGTHPSAEGMEQLLDKDNLVRRNYGPTYNHGLCAFGFKWGVSAQIALLTEVQLLQGQADSWRMDLNRLAGDFASWVSSDEAAMQDPF
ncbi:MAG: hypothetical protein M3457_07905 [Chloroflexota bacterium]|nr:hypothetical protein [Chloroflexota bacterium]